MNVIDLTVHKDMCIGCGICAVVCPENCIEIVYTSQKEFIPSVSQSKCTSCGRCTTYCPHTKEHLDSENALYDSSVHPESIGLEDAKYYHIKVKNHSDLLNSTSGGAVTAIIRMLFEKKRIDTVIHAEAVQASNGHCHYQITESKNAQEASMRSGTIYGPLHYDEIIQKYKGCTNHILLIGTPCVIRSLKKVFSNCAEYKQNHLLTCALICSHNVNGQFTDFLGEYYHIPTDEKYIANMRAKDDAMPDCSNYYTLFTRKDRKILAKENRYQGPFTNLWRGYYFAMPPCLECRDFWGREADFSAKDAWGQPGRKERYGSSIVIVRNHDLMSLIESMDSIQWHFLSKREVLISQKNTVDWKQVKNNKNCHNDKTQYAQNIRTSKKHYQKQGFKTTCQQILNQCPLPSESINDKKFFAIGNHLKNYFNKRISIINKRMHMHPFIKEDNCNKIIMFGGFSSANEGDEAQIDETYHILKERYPKYMVKILSHVQQYTFTHHAYCAVGDNSRLALWNIDSPKSNTYLADTSADKIKFLLRGIFMVLNAWLVRFNLPTFGLTARQSAFLYEIKTSKMVYISGGGFLTGDTLSRLWDHLFVMEIASIFRVPYVLSGQTIGLWNSEFTKKFAAREFAKAKAITLRDPDASISALKDIGVSGENIFVMFDDALFCQKEEDISPFLKKAGLNSEKYIVMNIHYWGAETSRSKQMIMKKLENILNIILEKSSYHILLLPMAAADLTPIKMFYNKNKTTRLHMISSWHDDSYDFKTIRGIIAKAECCITMKHHPIVFAMGECVPTIALSFQPYYVTKNTGALKMFNMERYCIDLSDKTYAFQFNTLYQELIEKKELIQKDIQHILPIMRRRREKLLQIMDDYLT